MAATTSINLVQLVQTLETQQEQYAQATAELNRMLREQLGQQSQAADSIGATLGQISSLLTSLLGGGASGASRSMAASSSQAGQSHQGTVTRTAPGSRGGTRRRGRRGSGTTGSESVLAFVGDRKNPTSAELAQHWKSEGRGGKVDNMLGLLVRGKKLKRTPIPGARGSRYMLI